MSMKAKKQYIIVDSKSGMEVKTSVSIFKRSKIIGYFSFTR